MITWHLTFKIGDKLKNIDRFALLTTSIQPFTIQLDKSCFDGHVNCFANPFEFLSEKKNKQWLESRWPCNTDYPEGYVERKNHMPKSNHFLKAQNDARRTYKWLADWFNCRLDAGHENSWAVRRQNVSVFI